MTEFGIDDLDSASSIDAVKDSVVQSFESADSGVRIHRTEYFNHTYAPDLVLEWPSEKTVRRVYLRTTSNVGYLREDLSLIDEKASIMMPLGQNLADTVDLDSELDTSSHMQHVLVARPSSVNRLGTRRSADPVLGLASRAMLQGGSGTLGVQKAEDFSDAFVAGFDGAQESDQDKTGAALDLAESLLDTKRNRQVGDFLHAVWIGSGGDSLEYPGEINFDASLNASGLSLLLETADIDSDTFWARIGRNLTMDKVQELEVDQEHENFQRLIRAAARNLKVRSCRVASLSGEHIAAARWFAAHGELGLRFRDLTILLSAKNLAEISRPGVSQEVSVATVAERAVKAEIDLSEVTIDANDRRLDYATADGTSVTDDARLTALHASMGRSAYVSRVVVQNAATDLLVDFKTSTARGRTASNFFMSTIVMKSIPLLADLDDTGLGQLSVVVGIDDSIADGADEAAPAPPT